MSSAQSYQFAGAQSVVPANGLSHPYGTAVDASGDVYIADIANKRVVEILAPANGGGQITVPLSGLGLPSGLAIDAAGDLFVADYLNNQVWELPHQLAVPTSGLLNPLGVAVDAAGDIFIADSGNHRVVKVLAHWGVQVAVGSVGFNRPNGVAVDSIGNVFVADSGANQVVVVPVAGGGQTTLSVSGLVSPNGVAVDAADRLFISDNSGLVWEIAAGGGQQKMFGNLFGLSYPQLLSVDRAGDVFIPDSFNNRVVKVQTESVDFGSANVCQLFQEAPAPCSQTLTLYFNVAASGPEVGVVKALTGGSQNLDFTAFSSECASNTLTGGLTCYVNVSFSPKFAGSRPGAVQFLDIFGNTRATTLVYGRGVGPQAGFSAATQIVIKNSLPDMRGIAVDQAGNVFVVNHIWAMEFPAGGGEQILLQGPPTGVTGVALDAAEDLFFIDSNNNRVAEVLAGSGAQITVPTNGLYAPQGLALDPAGNLFIADTFNNRIVEVLADSGAQITVPTNGLSRPYAVALDAAGDLFIADTDNNRVVEVLAGSGTQITLPISGLVEPRAVAVNAAGDVFIVDDAGIVKVPAAGGAPTNVPISGSLSPFGIALDAVGDLFFTTEHTNGPDSYTYGVSELQFSKPTLAFPGTAAGSRSSPISLTLGNIGNAPLTQMGLSVIGNFAQVAGSGTPADCSVAGSMLAPGAECNISLIFAPTAGGTLNSGSATVLDNSLNAATPVPQTIPLTGAGLYAGQTITFPAITAGSAGTPVSLTATASSGLPVSFNSSTSTVCTVSGSSALLISAGTCIITASQAGNSAYAPAPSVIRSFTVTPSTLPTSATYVGLDTTTQGTWTGKYGVNGHIIAQETAAPLSFATVTLSGDSAYTWAASTTDPRALQTASGASTRIASTFYSGTSYAINVDLTDGKTHRVALYLLDWDGSARVESIQILNAATSSVLATESYSSFHNGDYAAWDITGDVIIKVTQSAGANAVVSGILFD